MFPQTFGHICFRRIDSSRQIVDGVSGDGHYATSVFEAVKQGQKLSHPYSTMDFCVEIAVELEQLERVFDSIKGPCVHFSFEA
jgi:hypothetical protein